MGDSEKISFKTSVLTFNFSRPFVKDLFPKARQPYGDTARTYLPAQILQDYSKQREQKLPLKQARRLTVC